MSTERSNLLEQLAAPGTVVNGKYRVDRVIGEGGMGLVVEAWHLDFDERVAIKFLMPTLGTNSEAVARFEREARVLFKIKSPHVCRVLDVGRLDSGSPFLVLEFLEGEDLANRLVHRTASPLEDAVDWIVEACDAVSEAHARGIVHRDIKPENLFLARSADGRSRIKVLDFGLSKIAEANPVERQRALTSTEQAMGTPHYMAPEQWLSARDVGPASDQWSLAVILYELLAGVPPFDGDQLPQVCSAVLHAPMPSLAARAAQVPQQVEEALRRALAKDPAHRYETLAGFANALAPFGRSESRAIASRIARMFEQADQLLRSAEMARLTPATLAAISASYPGIVAPPRASDPGGASASMPASTPAAVPSAPTAAPALPLARPSAPAEPSQGAVPAASPWMELSLGGHTASPVPNNEAVGDGATGSQRKRLQTAQSWQQPLSADRPSLAAPSARKVGAIAFVSALAVLGVLGVLLGPRVVAAVRGPSPTGASPTGASPASSSSALPSAAAEQARKADPSAVLPLASAAPSASAAPPASAVPPASTVPGAALPGAFSAFGVPKGYAAPKQPGAAPLSPSRSVPPFGGKSPKPGGSIFDAR